MVQRSESGNYPETSLQINPEILEALRLTQDDVEKFSKEKVIREQKIQELFTQGKEYYDGAAFNQGFKRFEPVFGLIPGQETKIIPSSAELLAEFPDDLFAQLKKITNSLDESTQQESIERFQAFMEGLGSKALDKRDIRVAIPALDLASNGGILNNGKALDKINNMFENDSTKRIDVARIIQERFNRTGDEFSHKLPSGGDLIRTLQEANEGLPTGPSPTPTPEITATPEPTPTWRPTKTPTETPIPAFTPPLRPAPTAPSTDPELR